jgi:polyhydroxybutyrate depolymerase
MGACTAWDATSACCVPSSDGRDGGDVPMLREVISRTKEHFPVDASRIYVVGIANGGFMALRLACEMGSELAGVVAYASGLYASQCALKTGVPMLLMQGNADVVVPFAGGYNSAGVSFPGFRESKTIWSSINGCSASPAQSNWTARAGNNAPLNIAVSTYGDCTRDPLVAWEIDKGQHFALPDTSAVIFQKALRTFLWPLRAKASSV